MITSREKKEYVILALILVATLWVVYSNFIAPKNGAGPVQGTGNSGPTPATAVSSDSTAAPQASGSGFLPNGANIDLGPIQDPRFKQLVPPNYPQVNRGEVGNPNPFK